MSGNLTVRLWPGLCGGAHTSRARSVSACAGVQTARHPEPSLPVVSSCARETHAKRNDRCCGVLSYSGMPNSANNSTRRGPSGPGAAGIVVHLGAGHARVRGRGLLAATGTVLSICRRYCRAWRRFTRLRGSACSASWNSRAHFWSVGGIAEAGRAVATPARPQRLEACFLGRCAKRQRKNDPRRSAAIGRGPKSRQSPGEESTGGVEQSICRCHRGVSVRQRTQGHIEASSRKPGPAERRLTTGVLSIA